MYMTSPSTFQKKKSISRGVCCSGTHLTDYYTKIQLYSFIGFNIFWFSLCTDLRNSSQITLLVTNVTGNRLITSSFSMNISRPWLYEASEKAIGRINVIC